MHVTEVYPPAPKPPQAVDYSDVAELQRKLMTESEALSGLAHDLGQAKHIIEYDSDLRKRALARAMRAALAGGDSVNRAEAEARASLGYDQELAVLAKQHEAATTTISEYEARRCAWETARSLLSMMKTQVGQL